MKTVIILLFAFCYVESRKILQPLDKNANIAFINMEGGGGVRPAPTTKPAAQATPVKPVVPTPVPTPAPVNKPPSPPASPKQPAKPVAPVTTPKPALPAQPTQITPKPVNPPPVANPITTPGPGSVKQLINFYDSQGKASQIRPYSYSQAVKQG